MKKLTDSLKRAFLVESDGKRTLNKKSVTFSLLVVVVLGFGISKVFSEPENSAILQHASKELINDDKFHEEIPKEHNHVMASGPIKDASTVKNRPNKVIRVEPTPAIKLMARQVITRDDLPREDSSLPTGSNFIGKLISTIDTRDAKQFIKVLLPYGGSFDGKKVLDKDTMILGTAQYMGIGEKIYLSFTKAILPDGQEMEINAQALDPSDYSSGIRGEYHGTAGVRIATTLGLSMVSGMTEVLTEKKVHGESGAITPRSTMKNALYHGVSKVSEMEASRQASELGQEKAYVTVEAGTDLIISLTAPLRGVKE